MFNRKPPKRSDTLRKKVSPVIKPLSLAGEKLKNEQKILEKKAKEVANSIDLTKIELRAAAKKKSWRELPVKYKEEMVLEWHMNNGVFKGKRYFRHDFAKELGLTEASLDLITKKIVNQIESDMSNPAMVQKNVMEVVSNVGFYLKSDRARAVMHADILEKELEYILEKKKEIDAYPENTEWEKIQKEKAETRISAHFRSISFHHMEAIRLLFESTDAANRYLALFAGAGSKSGKGGALQALLEASKPGEGDAPGAGSNYVDHRTAIEILDERGSVLPSQSIEDINTNPRNPHEGFEELTEPEE